MSTIPWADAWRQFLPAPSSFWAGRPASAAVPENFAQSVLPGWNFGTVVNLTEENSTPQIEAAVLSKQSYGRQLGQITDALQVLITERAQAGKAPDAALDKFSTMKDEIDRIKAGGIEARVRQLRNDLAAMKEHDESAYKRLHDELLEVLQE